MRNAHRKTREVVSMAQALLLRESGSRARARVRSPDGDRRGRTDQIRSEERSRCKPTSLSQRATADARTTLLRRPLLPPANLDQQGAERDQDARHDEEHRVFVKRRQRSVGAVVRVGEIQDVKRPLCSNEQADAYEKQRLDRRDPETGASSRAAHERWTITQGLRRSRSASSENRSSSLGKRSTKRSRARRGRTCV